MKSFISTACRAASMLAAIILLAACGQKGPLYLPQNDDQNDSQPAAAATVDETQPAAPEANTNI